MTERRIAVSDRVLHFNGTFRLVEIDAIIKEAISKYQYFLDTYGVSIVTKDESRDIDYSYFCIKFIGKNRMAQLSMSLSGSGTVPVLVLDAGVKVMAQRGKLKVTFFGIIKSERENLAARWPMMYFWTQVRHHLFWNSLSRIEAAELQDIVDELYKTINLYLSQKHFQEVLHG